MRFTEEMYESVHGYIIKILMSSFVVGWWTVTRLGSESDWRMTGTEVGRSAPFPSRRAAVPFLRNSSAWGAGESKSQVPSNHYHLPPVACLLSLSRLPLAVLSLHRGQLVENVMRLNCFFFFIACIVGVYFGFFHIMFSVVFFSFHNYMSV